MRALYSVWVIKLEKQRKGIKKKQQQPQRRQKGDRILNVKSRVERVLLSHRIVKTYISRIHLVMLVYEYVLFLLFKVRVCRL